MERPAVHVTGRIPAAVAGLATELFDLSEDPEGVDGVLALTATEIDEAFMRRCGERLKIVAIYGAGTDRVDLAAARARKVVVTNAPDALTRATAEFTVGLMLALLRRIAEGDRLIRGRGLWTRDLEFMLGPGLEDANVAIVGAGRIGRETARVVETFGAHSRFVGRGDDLVEALAAADVVSLHCPLTPATHHLVGSEAFGSMRPSAVLVNTARGPIVDERALVAALRNRQVAGAALDVFEFEPAVSEDLLALDNVVLTPHLGSATRATRERMGRVALEALEEVLINKHEPVTRVA